MSLKERGKLKNGLPIYNKLTPKSPTRWLRKRHVIGIILGFVIINLVLFKGYMSNYNGVTFHHAKADIPEINPENDYELYHATSEGIVQGDVVKTYDNTVEFYDLANYHGLADGREDGILFCMPLRNAEDVLPMAFYNIMNLTYDHSKIDIAFLVLDCLPDDRTLETVFEYLVALQNGTLVDLLRQEEELKQQTRGLSQDLYKLYMDQAYIEGVRKAYNPETPHHANFTSPFRLVSIFRKDFGQVIGQGFSDRHAVKVQGIRRKLMGRARNWLTALALKPYHSWVYWRDVDIETCPGDVIETLMKHDYDVLVPNVWRPLPAFLDNEQPYDLNLWEESDAALNLAKTLDEDDVIVEGYAEYPTWRFHLAYLRDPNGNPDDLVNLDGIGGVLILARAAIIRQGVNFPAFTFENHAETEAFGKMARKMGFKVGGLPHYTIWHIYEPSEDDLQKIAKMEREKRRKGPESA